MQTLSESGQAIAQARDEILAHLARIESEHRPAPSPRELIAELARGRDGDPFRAAITSLIAARVIEASPTWKLHLRSDRITT